jgi:hypothetical protein
MAISFDLSPRVRAALVELVSAIAAQTRASIIQELTGGEPPSPKRRGRPPKNPTTTALSLVPRVQEVSKPRKKAPKQLCPVPGCKNPAAPIFGMVCAKHKDLPKLKIKQYREARRAKQAKAKNIRRNGRK